MASKTGVTKQKAQKTRTSQSPGGQFVMPAEWEPHRATWLCWPHNPNDWPGKIEPVKWTFCEIVRKITPSETVRLLVDSPSREKEARLYLSRAGVDLRKVQFIVKATDRSWLRDCGPIFARETHTNRTVILDFHFNGWAKYPNWRKDATVPAFAAQFLKKPLIDVRIGKKPFVLEGGGIEVNGKGTLITTEECYLDQKIQPRNPGITRAEFESTVRNYLGATNVFWLGHGIVGDDTHGHVDDLCRFVGPKTIVLVREDNPKDANFRNLAENWERIQDLRLEDGSKPEIVALPMPSPIYYDGYRLPASYANFYFTNTALLVPTFNDPKDITVLGILSELVKDRQIIGIYAGDLILGLGAIHCLTQQEPL